MVSTPVLAGTQTQRFGRTIDTTFSALDVVNLHVLDVLVNLHAVTMISVFS